MTAAAWAVRIAFAVLLANVAPRTAAVTAHRDRSGSRSLFAADRTSRAARARRELQQMKATAAEVSDVIVSAARELDSALLQRLGASGTAGSAPLALRAASANRSRAAVDGPARGGFSANTSAALKAEQDVLKKLLTRMKSSISRLNKGEGSSKSMSLNMTQRLSRRLEQDRARAHDPNLSAADRELYANRSRVEEDEMKYWSRGRELQHGMYHANIKMTHGLMARVKTVMDAYQAVLEKGHLSTEQAQALRAASSGLTGAKSGAATA